LQSGIQTVESRIQTSDESGILILGQFSGIRNPSSGIRNPRSGIRNPRRGVRNLRSGIQNPRSAWITLHGPRYCRWKLSSGNSYINMNALQRSLEMTICYYIWYRIAICSSFPSWDIQLCLIDMSSSVWHHAASWVSISIGNHAVASTIRD
jgi:hypothetical protein